MAWYQAVLSAWDYLPRIFIAVSLHSECLFPILSPHSAHLGAHRCEHGHTYGLYRRGPCPRLQSLCLILMASYSQIPTLCLIMVGMNAKYTLQGRWGDTTQQTEITFSNVTGFMTVRPVVYVIKSNQIKRFSSPSHQKPRRAYLSGEHQG